MSDRVEQHTFGEYATRHNEWLRNRPKDEWVCVCGHPQSQHDEAEGCRVYIGGGPDTCPCTTYTAKDGTP